MLSVVQAIEHILNKSSSDIISRENNTC